MGKVITQNSENHSRRTQRRLSAQRPRMMFPRRGCWMMVSPPRGRHRCRRAGGTWKSWPIVPARLCRDGQLHQDSPGLCLRLQAFFRLVPAPEPFSSPRTHTSSASTSPLAPPESSAKANPFPRSNGAVQRSPGIALNGACGSTASAALYTPMLVVTCIPSGSLCEIMEPRTSARVIGVNN